MRRGHVSQDFFEKTFDVLSDKVDGTDDHNLVFIYMRMIDTFPYVVSLTKRRRGSPHKGYFQDNIARSELKNRGLLK